MRGRAPTVSTSAEGTWKRKRRRRTMMGQDLI
jgi:hypothetical protein